jgi:hypothetical protein
MIQRSTPPRSQRAAILSLAVALHLSLLALFMTIGVVHPLPAARPSSLSLISLTPEPAGKPPPALPSKTADPQRSLRPPAFSDEADSDATGAAGGCATLPLVMRSLVANAAAVDAVRQAPAESRSIADAVVLWNAGWSPDALTPDAPLAPARAAVEDSLRGLPAQCLDEPVAGPRLVPIPDQDRTMFLVIGSGNWAWRQLLDTEKVEHVQPEQPSLWDWF